MNHLNEQLIHMLSLAKQKPYLPFWGEVFYLLKKIEKEAHLTRRSIIVYNIQPMGTIFFDPREQMFIVEIPNISIKLKVEELTSQILKGKFPPRKEYTTS